MQRIGNLFPAFCSFENLLSAYRKARKGSRANQENAAFYINMEKELLQLQEQLREGAWQPQPYRFFEIHDPKERTIAVSAFRDRVVHHALVNLLEPIYERRFIYDSYATRKGKGVHAAVDRAQRYLRQYDWFLKSDVQKYFDSVDHNVLLHLLERKIKDRRLLEVSEVIIRHGGQDGKGLPIGNRTSQFFANVYLHALDAFVKQDLHVKGYVRYMDDFVLFEGEKSVLKDHRKRIESFLGEKLGLALKPGATFLNGYRNGLSFLGRRIFRGVVRLRPENLRRITKRLRQREWEFENGHLQEESFLQSMNSYWAMLRAYPLAGLRASLLAKGHTA